MRICGISIRNYRSIEAAEISIGDITRIIGANGAGKSSILKAIELFYTTSPSALTQDDFYNRDRSMEIEITLRFHRLSKAEKARFGSQIKPDNTLVVTRVFTSDQKNSGKYYGTALRCPDFEGIRAVEKATDKKNQYGIIRERYPELPPKTRADEIEPALQEWEATHPQSCIESRDDGQFFGFQNVARGKLSDSTMLVYIPAVRDASTDTIDGKNTAVARLLDLLVKSEIERRPDIRRFKEETDQRFQEIMSPENLSELSTLATTLSGTLGSFYANTAVLLKWRDPEPITIQFPAADMTLDDDGFISAVDRTGHGLQRALIITLLQHLAVATQSKAVRADGSGSEAAPPDEEQKPSLILAIEEPELYQHPTKQRHVSQVLQQLAAGKIPGVAPDTQVVFTTHSPFFVTMDSFEEVRLVRRQRTETTSLRCCGISTADLDSVAKKVARLWGHPEDKFTGASLKPRLHVIDGTVAEGFFSGTAVLVEGISDRAALLAAAKHRGVDLGALEIAVIPVGGKSILDKPYLIFQELGIPTFVMWDCDASKMKKDQSHGPVNRALQAMVGRPSAEIVDVHEAVGPNFACFDENLESTLSNEIGVEIWNSLLDTLKEKYGVSGRDDAQKIPGLMLELISEASIRNSSSITLTKIIDAILSLRKSYTEPTTYENSQVVCDVVDDLNLEPAPPAPV